MADGRRQEVHFDKITYRIKKLCYGLNMEFVDPVCETVCTRKTKFELWL